MNETQKLTELLELANNYPSPHNGQPMQLVSTAAGGLELFFDTSRGLTATPISYLFSFVTIGVFVRHFELCAQALGHTVKVDLTLPDQTQMAQPSPLSCGKLLVTYDVAQPDNNLQTAILSRQTSRKKYTAGISEQEKQAVQNVADQYGLSAQFVPPDQARQVIWLNQRAVFDDMFDPDVRGELNHWFRYNAAEKIEKQDGLAYDCMELSGSAMRFAVKHYKMLHWPIVAPIVQRYYTRTMMDSSSVGYVTAPFQTEQQGYAIGQCIMDIWMDLTKAGHYLHPFGTIVSNDKAHADFCKVVGLQKETRDANYVSFIFRAGASEKPVESERVPVAKHMYNQAQQW